MTPIADRMLLRFLSLSVTAVGDFTPNNKRQLVYEDELLFKIARFLLKVTGRMRQVIVLLILKQPKPLTNASLKVPISSKFLFSHLIPYFMQWTLTKKNFKFDDFFYEVLKPETPTLMRSTRAADHIIYMLRVVTQIQERVTSGLTYLACFTSVKLASWSMQNAPFQHFVWTTKFNLQRWNKRDESSLKSCVP